MLTPEAQSIIGPQIVTGDYYDQTLLAQAKKYGEMFPAMPPPPELMDNYVLMNYYDLARSCYVAYQRTDDSMYLTLARKVADSWWLCPYSKGGTTSQFAEGEGVAPRLAGIIGLILRALDGRPEMWGWITSYTRFHFDNWLKKRVNDAQLYYGLREGAFLISYATALAKAHPDAAVRSEMLADVENVTINYFGRLQQAEGSWRWDDWDASGGPYIGIMQPFMVGLTTRALCDVHALTANAIVKESAKHQILKACRHLYSDGPFSRQIVTNFNVPLGGFHYFYHGGTQAEPTKYEKGDFPLNTTERWHVDSARQATSTILGPFAYAYKTSGDEFFKQAGEEIYRFAYSGTDGFRAMMSDTAKNFNQHVLGTANYKAWLGAVAEPVPQPLPAPPPTPTKTESPDGSKSPPDFSIVDSNLVTWTIGSAPNFLIYQNGVYKGGQGTVLKYWNKSVYTLGMDANWWQWMGGDWRNLGASEPGVTQPVPLPQPPPVPIPVLPPPPAPVPAPPRTITYPKQSSKRNSILDAQWKERYRLVRENDNGTATFEKVS